MKKIFALLLSLAISTSGAVAMAQTEKDNAKEKNITTEERLAEREKYIAQRTLIRADAENEQEVSLFASNVTLSGKISLPTGKKALDDTYVYVEAIPVGERIINATNTMSGIEEHFVLDKGKSSVSYSMSIPEGDYIIAIFAYGAAENTLTGTTYYYSEAGLSTDASMAKRVEMTANKTLDFTFEEAKKTISGTITFTEPASESGYAYFYAETDTDNRYNYVYSDVELYIEKGAKKIDYTIPVAEGTTNVSFNLPDCQSKYFSILDELSEYEDARYFNTEAQSYTDIDYTYDNSEEETGEVLTVNITLPEAVKERTHLRVILNNDYSTAKNVTLKNGAKTAFVTFPVPAEDFTVRVTNHEDVDYYYNESLGGTSNKENADIIEAGTQTVNFVFPECYTLTGTVTRNGMFEGNLMTSDIEAVIGSERFASKVNFEAKSDTATYSISIPEYLKDSEAEVCVYPTYDIAVSDVVTVGDKMSLDFEYPENCTILLSGTITLTEPAPEGGVGIAIGYNEMNYLYIPEGDTSLEYTAEIANREADFEENGFVDLECLFYSENMNFCGSAYEMFDIADLENCDITFEPVEYVKISGVVKIPGGVNLTSGVTCEINMFTDYDYISTYCSIGKNETEVPYSFYLEKGDVIYDFTCTVVSAGTSPVTGYDIRCVYDGDADWSEIDVLYDINNANFTLENALTVECYDASITDSGVDVSLTYTNYTDTPFTFPAILAGYDENNTLQDVEMINITLSDYEGDETFTIPAEIDDTLTYKVLFWNSIKDMFPMVPVAEVN